MWREKKKDRNRSLDRKLGLLVNRYAKKPANSHWGDSARFLLLSLGFLVPAPERAFLAEPAVAWPPAVHHAAVPALLLAGSLARPSRSCCSLVVPRSGVQTLLLAGFLPRPTWSCCSRAVRRYLTRPFRNCCSLLASSRGRPGALLVVLRLSHSTHCCQEEEREQNGVEDPATPIMIKCE